MTVITDNEKSAPIRPRALSLGTLAEAVAALAVAAWVGGVASLGAFAARIAFRDLPRAQAATLMNTVFRSFDRFAAVALAVFALASLVRALSLGERAWRGAGLVATVASVLLIAVGLCGVLWVHPAITAMFHADETLTPRFAAMHHLSERIGHAEALLTALLYGAYAWSHRRRIAD